MYFKVREIIRILMAALFVWAGIVKLGDTTGFASSIHSFQLTSTWQSMWVANTLPLLEIICGVFLILPGRILPLSGAFLSMVLSCTFLFVFIWAWVENLTPHCGCIGKWLESTPKTGTLRSIILVLLSFYLIRSNKDKNCPKSYSKG